MSNTITSGEQFTLDREALERYIKQEDGELGGLEFDIYGGNEARALERRFVDACSGGAIVTVDVRGDGEIIAVNDLEAVVYELVGGDMVILAVREKRGPLRQVATTGIDTKQLFPAGDISVEGMHKAIEQCLGRISNLIPALRVIQEAGL